MNMNNTEYAPDGSVFYEVVEYPSYICRVQRMVAGPNGKFSKRYDGKWVHHGSYKVVFTNPEDANDVAHAGNITNLDFLEHQIELIKTTYYNLVAYTRGERR